MGDCQTLAGELPKPSNIDDASLFCTEYCINIDAAALAFGHGSWPTLLAPLIAAQCPSACKDSIVQRFTEDAFPAAFCNKMFGRSYTSDWCDLNTGIDRDGHVGTVTVWPLDVPNGPRVELPCNGSIQAASFPDYKGTAFGWRCSDSDHDDRVSINSDDPLAGKGIITVTGTNEEKNWGYHACRLNWGFS